MFDICCWEKFNISIDPSALKTDLFDDVRPYSVFIREYLIESSKYFEYLKMSCYL